MVPRIIKTTRIVHDLILRRIPIIIMHARLIIRIIIHLMVTDRMPRIIPTPYASTVVTLVIPSLLAISTYKVQRCLYKTFVFITILLANIVVVLYPAVKYIAVTNVVVVMQPLNVKLRRQISNEILRLRAHTSPNPAQHP